MRKSLMCSINPEERPVLAAKITQHFENFLVDNGYRLTKQRKIVVLATLDSGVHFDAEKVLQEAKKLDSSIGFATIYRNLQLMVKAGILVELDFISGRKSFELVFDLNRHHDHLICEDCGEVIEFSSPEIEKLQEQIARQMGFQLSGHRLILRGHTLSKETCACKENTEKGKRHGE